MSDTSAYGVGFPVAPRTPPPLPRTSPPWPEMLAAHLRSGTGGREVRRRQRNEQRPARRRRWHLAQVESAPDPLSRASAASDYLRAVLARMHPEDAARIVTEHVDHTLHLIDTVEGEPEPTDDDHDEEPHR